MNLAELEAEIFLEVGIWRNFDELEESINIEELAALRKVLGKREHRHNTFAAALKGIKLDDPEKDAYDKELERVKRKAQMRIDGVDFNEASIETAELTNLGIDVIVVE